MDNYKHKGNIINILIYTIIFQLYHLKLVEQKEYAYVSYDWWVYLPELLALANRQKMTQTPKMSLPSPPFVPEKHQPNNNRSHFLHEINFPERGANYSYLLARAM